MIFTVILAIVFMLSFVTSLVFQGSCMKKKTRFERMMDMIVEDVAPLLLILSGFMLSIATIVVYFINVGGGGR